jgi:hypothetical protein
VAVRKENAIKANLVLMVCAFIILKVMIFNRKTAKPVTQLQKSN